MRSLNILGETTLFTSLSRLLSFTLYTLVDLLPMNGNFFGRINPYTNLIALNTQHRYRNIITDHQGLTHSTCQY